MTDDQLSEQRRRSRGVFFGRTGALAWLALTILGSAAVMWVSLSGVDGAVRQGPDPADWRTEFVNAGWWMGGVLLSIPAFFAARGRPLLAIPAVAVPAVAMFAVAQITVNRYVESGWSDGLESFSYVLAAGMTFAVVSAAIAGRVVGRAGPRAILDDQARRDAAGPGARRPLMPPSGSSSLGI